MDIASPRITRIDAQCETAIRNGEEDGIRGGTGIQASGPMFSKRTVKPVSSSETSFSSIFGWTIVLLPYASFFLFQEALRTADAAGSEGPRKQSSRESASEEHLASVIHNPALATKESRQVKASLSGPHRE